MEEANLDLDWVVFFLSRIISREKFYGIKQNFPIENVTAEKQRVTKNSVTGGARPKVRYTFKPRGVRLVVIGHFRYHGARRHYHDTGEANCVLLLQRQGIV